MLESPDLAIRLRDSWEAVDLGFVLVRRHWRAVLVAWLSLAIPLTALLFVLFRARLWIPPLVFWWLKPVLDRMVLQVLAKATFGEVPTLRETIRHAGRSFRHGTVAMLFWRRFSPQRSFVLPVWQLEEQPGEGYRKRCKVLLRRGRGQAVLLTYTCFLCNLALCLSILLAVALFVPVGSDFSVMDAAFGSGADRVGWVDLLLSLLPFVAAAVLEPFYVGGGFALYLNRRVELEGWDLEVAFRKIASRVAKALGRALALVMLAWAPLRLEARPEPREALAEVLRGPEFQVTQRRKGLHWKPSDPSKSRREGPPPNLERLLKLLASIAKWSVIAAASATLAYVLWRNRGHLLRRPRVSGDGDPPDALFGLDIRPETLPPGLARLAAELWARGSFRAALALLYRGALAHLVHRLKAPVSSGSTESECLRTALPLLPPPSAAYLERLTRAWLEVAYADRVPAPEDISLCSEWGRHFQETAREARP